MNQEDDAALPQGLKARTLAGLGSTLWTGCERKEIPPASLSLARRNDKGREVDGHGLKRVPFQKQI
jgi:hypothetical protein